MEPARSDCHGQEAHFLLDCYLHLNSENLADFKCYCSTLFQTVDWTALPFPFSHGAGSFLGVRILRLFRPYPCLRAVQAESKSTVSSTVKRPVARTHVSSHVGEQGNVGADGKPGETFLVELVLDH